MTLDLMKQILTSRLVQVATKIAGLGAAYLAARWGADAGNLLDPAAIGAAVGSGAALAWDVVVHRIQHGVWFFHAPATPAASNEDSDLDLGIAEESK